MKQQFQFQSMNESFARSISGWTYEAPYGLYSWDNSVDNIQELMSGTFWAATMEAELAGFMCTGESARIPGGYEQGIYDLDGFIDLGLGLRPDLTGKGWGETFLSSCMAFAENSKNGGLPISGFRLVVAAFNKRAIKVYERAGFVRGDKFKSRVEAEELDFYVMVLKNVEIERMAGQDSS